MSNARDAHHEAAGFAGLKVEELEGIILHGKSFLEDEVRPTIENAVGAAPGSEAGQNAAAFAGGLMDRLEEAVGICEQIKAELNRYAGGF